MKLTQEQLNQLTIGSGFITRYQNDYIGTMIKEANSLEQGLIDGAFPVERLSGIKTRINGIRNQLKVRTQGIDGDIKLHTEKF